MRQDRCKNQLTIKNRYLEINTQMIVISNFLEWTIFFELVNFRCIKCEKLWCINNNLYEPQSKTCQGFTAFCTIALKKYQKILFVVFFEIKIFLW